MAGLSPAELEEARAALLELPATPEAIAALDAIEALTRGEEGAAGECLLRAAAALPPPLGPRLAELARRAGGERVSPEVLALERLGVRGASAVASPRRLLAERLRAAVRRRRAAEARLAALERRVAARARGLAIGGMVVIALAGFVAALTCERLAAPPAPATSAP